MTTPPAARARSRAWLRALAALGMAWTGLALACAPAGAQAGPGVRPNVVVILADDLGYGDLGAYGHPTIRTPNLDRMASEGLKLTQFYTAESVCTPSRAALLTGRLPVRNGMSHDRHRVLFPNSLEGLPQSEVTLAELLRARGYATAAVGKWHLGHLPEYLPTRHGFDEYFGIPYSNDMDLVGGGEHRQANLDPRIEYFNVPLMRGETVIERPADQRTITRRYTEEAVRFIRENRRRPFFLYLAHNLPHVPLFASDAFLGKSPRGRYGDTVEEIDWSVGRVLATLRELDLDRRTLVVFTSDNGPWLTFGAHGGSSGLLREGKGATWEGGMRVPAIAWWPGTVRAGGVSQALATTMDLFPTAAAMAGAPMPRDRAMDGVSLLPLLRGEREQVRDMVLFYRGSRVYALRKGPWKAHFITQPGYGPGGPVEHSVPELYHLEHDPSESRNVAAENPAVIADLRRELERHLASVERVPSRLEARASR